MNATNLKKIIIEEIENYNKDQHSIKAKDVKILLYNYNKYQNKIKIFRKELEDLEQNLIIKKGKVEDIKVQQSMIFKSELEKVEEQKEKLELKINKLIYITTKICDALSVIQDEPYYDIIVMKYFNRSSTKEICSSLYISESTFNRYHNKLIKELKSILFL